MTVVYVLLLVAAAVAFLLYALNVRVGGRRPIDLLGVGLLLWVLVEILRVAQRL